MRKLSEINEGFWKSGINRAKTNTMRLGDIPDGHNLDNFDPVDFDAPFVFSDVDLYIDSDIAYFTEQEKNMWVNFAKQRGWRLPTIAEINKYFLRNFISPRLKDKFNFEYNYLGPSSGGFFKLEMKKLLKHQERPKMIFYLREKDDFPIKYWLEDGELEIVNYLAEIAGFELTSEENMSSAPKRLRFVKDKQRRLSDMNEGFWKDGIKRAKDNIERLEDQLPPIPDKIKGIKTYRVIDFPEYFFTLDIADEMVFIDFYNIDHSPIDAKIGSMIQNFVVGEEPYFEEDDYKKHLSDDENEASNEEWKTMNDPKFISKFNATIYKLPKTTWDAKVNEGFWKDSIRRSKQNTLRKEDMISLEDAANYYDRPIEYIHAVDGYDNYFFSLIGGDSWFAHINIFHYPTKRMVARRYIDHNYECSKDQKPEFEKYTTDEDKKLISSKEFEDAINKSIKGMEVIM